MKGRKCDMKKRLRQVFKAEKSSGQSLDILGEGRKYDIVPVTGDLVVCFSPYYDSMYWLGIVVDGGRQVSSEIGVWLNGVLELPVGKIGMGRALPIRVDRICAVLGDSDLVADWHKGVGQFLAGEEVEDV